jgi:hypothetical protein
VSWQSVRYFEKSSEKRVIKLEDPALAAFGTVGYKEKVVGQVQRIITAESYRHARRWARPLQAETGAGHR